MNSYYSWSYKEIWGGNWCICYVENIWYQTSIIEW